KLSSSAPMIIGGQLPVKVGRCQAVKAPMLWVLFWVFNNVMAIEKTLYPCIWLLPQGDHNKNQG
ncbi:hypothetical protein, partial [Thalassorhabdus alkalitolerans]